MNLNDVLSLIAAQIHADPQELIAYANEDNIGGYDIDEFNRMFPMGSLWAPEGQILYALTRWRKPAVVVEIGGWAGCSATHFATAIKANGFGKVISVDSGIGGQEHGKLIPPHLRDVVELVNSEGGAWLQSVEAGGFGLIFEDADHSVELVQRLSALAALRLAPGGILANHDAGHDFAWVGNPKYQIASDVGQAVRIGLERAGIYSTAYLAEPSDCGLAVAIMPGEWVSQAPDGVKEKPAQAAAPKASKPPVADAWGDQWSNRLSQQPAAQGIAPIESASPPPAPLSDADRLARQGLTDLELPPVEVSEMHLPDVQEKPVEKPKPPAKKTPAKSTAKLKSTPKAKPTAKR